MWSVLDYLSGRSDFEKKGVHEMNSGNEIRLLCFMKTD